jgi:hypothetical protein
MMAASNTDDAWSINFDRAVGENGDAMRQPLLEIYLHRVVVRVPTLLRNKVTLVN